MGVRYNAEKKKVGSYYSTPIYSFRCKCHLCDGWFEIQTDPKNTRYVVVSGARQKIEEWDPEENGGFAIHDTTGSVAPADPLATLEKSTEAQNHLTKVQVPRILQLQSASDHYNEDPYSASLRVRKRFRAEKKIEQAKQAADKQLKGKYALPEELKLLEDNATMKDEAHIQWVRGRADYGVATSSKRQKLIVPSFPGSTSLRPCGLAKGKDSAASALRERILGNTGRRSAPNGVAK